MGFSLLDQLAMVPEQFGVLRGAMASLRKIWHDCVELTVYSMLKTYEDVVEQCGVLRGAMSSLRLTRWQLFMLMLRKLFHDMPRFFRYTIFALVILGVIVVLDDIFARVVSLKRLGLPVMEFPKGDNRWDYKTILRLAKERVSLFFARFALRIEALRSS